MLTKEQEVIEVINDIRPGIQMDGGDIEFVAFDEKTGVVQIKLLGACVGCPMSSVTLKQGVEYMMQQALDFDIEVEDLTDHDAMMDEPHDINAQTRQGFKM